MDSPIEISIGGFKPRYFEAIPSFSPFPLFLLYPLSFSLFNSIHHQHSLSPPDDVLSLF